MCRSLYKCIFVIFVILCPRYISQNQQSSSEDSPGNPATISKCSPQLASALPSQISGGICEGKVDMDDSATRVPADTPSKLGTVRMFIRDGNRGGCASPAGKLRVTERGHIQVFSTIHLLQ